MPRCIFVPSPRAPTEVSPHEFPSVITYTSETEYVIGNDAKHRILDPNDPYPFAESSTTLLKYLLLEKDASVELRLSPDGRQATFSGERVVVDFLRALREHTSRHIDALIAAGTVSEDARLALDTVTLSKPAHAGPHYAARLVRCAREAGFDDVSIYEEPLATYQGLMALDARFSELLPKELALVVDIGCGTTDFALVESLPDGDVHLRNACEGGEWAGGYRLDQLLWDLIQSKLADRPFDSLEAELLVRGTESSHLREKATVWFSVDDIKRELTEVFLEGDESKCSVFFDFVKYHEEQSITVTRAEFEEVVDAVWNEIQAALSTFLNDCTATLGVDLTKRRALAEVVVTGGSSNVPTFHENVCDTVSRPNRGRYPVADNLMRYRDIYKACFTTTKAFVALGCSTRRPQVQERVHDMAALREAPDQATASEARARLAGGTLLHPTLRTRLRVEADRKGKEKAVTLSLSAGSGGLPIPWTRTLTHPHLRVPIGRRESWRLQLQTSESANGDRFETRDHVDVPVGLLDEAEIRASLDAVFEAQPERRAPTLEKTGAFLANLIAKHFGIALSPERLEALTPECADVLAHSETPGFWNASMDEVVDVLRSRPDPSKDLRVFLEDVGNAARSAHQKRRASRPLLTCAERLLGDLRVVVDVLVAEDGFVHLDIHTTAQSLPREAPPIEFRKRGHWLGPCFDPAEADRAPKSTWSLGIDFGTYGSCVALVQSDQEDQHGSPRS